MSYTAKIKYAFDTVPRNGLVDMWNSFMVSSADFVPDSNMPICKRQHSSIPTELVSYEDAKKIHRDYISAGNTDYMIDAYIHFFLDDQKFDGPRVGIWQRPHEALEIIKHFSGIIEPDFSTYQDFPDPIKRFNYYRMRAFGYWISEHNIPVIFNLRWSFPDSFPYCVQGIPCNSIVAVGAIASNLKYVQFRSPFELGLLRIIEDIHPSAIIFYGSVHKPFLEKLNKLGIKVVTFQSKTSASYNGGKNE